MAEKKKELLVYLQREHAEQAMEALRTHFVLTQKASRQLAVVRVALGQEEQVQAVEGVDGVFEGNIPEALYSHLDFSETLFVKAWEIRKQEHPKKLLGEGLDWDAEGFEPP